MNAATSKTVNSMALRGLQASEKFHLFGQVRKNLEATEQALDTINFTLAEEQPSYSPNIQLMRNLSRGVSDEAKLDMNRSLLRSLSHQGVAIAAGSVLPTLYAILEMAHAADFNDQFDIAKRKVFDLVEQIRKASFLENQQRANLQPKQPEQILLDF